MITLLGGISGAAYRPEELDDDRDLPVSYISAPVFDGTGTPRAELLIGPLRAAVSRKQRHHYLSAITESAGELAQSVVS